MLRTFIVGAIAAYAGSRLMKANEEGRLESLKAKVRDGADRLRNRLSEEPDVMLAPHRPLPAPPSASRRARKSADPMEISKPGKANPWPVDPRAVPGES